MNKNVVYEALWPGEAWLRLIIFMSMTTLILSCEFFKRKWSCGLLYFSINNFWECPIYASLIYVITGLDTDLLPVRYQAII